MTPRARPRLAPLAGCALPALVLVASLAVPAARGEEAKPGAATPSATTPATRTARPADAKLYIISPKDGEKVSNPVTVRFGLAGMGVAPAGVASPNTGHHHLLVDAPVPPADAPIPKDDHHLHFGAGQTETKLDLAPGAHTLQLVLGDKDHFQFDPPLVSEKVAITVK